MPCRGAGDLCVCRGAAPVEGNHIGAMRIGLLDGRGANMRQTKVFSRFRTPDFIGLSKLCSNVNDSL